jgi:hypothetical protein
MGNSDREKQLEKAKQVANHRENVARAAEPRLIFIGQGIRAARKRIDEGSFEESMIEMEPAVVEIGRLANIAHALKDAGFDISIPMKRFDLATPHAREGRNVFSHYEDYLLGIGRSQTEPGIPVTMFYERDSTSGTAVIMTNPNFRLDVGEFLNAGNDLTYDLLEAIESHRDN